MALCLQQRMHASAPTVQPNNLGHGAPRQFWDSPLWPVFPRWKVLYTTQMPNTKPHLDSFLLHWSEGLEDEGVLGGLSSRGGEQIDGPLDVRRLSYRRQLHACEAETAHERMHAKTQRKCKFHLRN